VNVGSIRIDPVVDGRILSPLPATKPFPDPLSPLWNDQQMFRAGDLVESTLGGFLVRTGDRVALIDAGAGPALDHSVPLDIVQGRLPASLDALGVHPDEITDVIFTHLHFDHIGWASAGGATFFPQATFRCATADLEYFLTGPEEEQFVMQLFGAISARERLAPVMDRVETWDTDGTLVPGIDVRLAAGHTPGSSVVVVSDGNARALLLGDIIHCPLELMDDDFELLVDHDRDLANRVREAYVRELEGSEVVAAAAHFPGLQFGRLLPGETTRRWTYVGA
jgi:glyoxylase-like metal-dependent hydrolase (beta-lactamase superfamily II)